MRQWQRISLALLVLLSVLAELWTPHDAAHAEYWWSGVPAFYALFGFIGCAVIILFSKAAGKFLLKKEDYYDAG